MNNSSIKSHLSLFPAKIGAFAWVFIVLSLVFFSAHHLIPTQSAPLIDFYGKKVSVLKWFGQKNYTESSPGQVTASKIYHASGVLVDSSGHLYVADTGNNRILAWNSYRENSPANLVFGQPNFSTGAANGDSNLGVNKPASERSLCLMSYPSGTNTAEQWMRFNFDVDEAGNFYFPDAYNNRVLVYYAPFGPKTGGGGDTVADFVIGQDNFSNNKINRGHGIEHPDAQSLNLSIAPMDGGSTRSVTVDPQGNVWVADNFNSRVLRFPRGAKVADLVLGQPDFTSKVGEQDITQAKSNQMWIPTVARINSKTGELWVGDEHAGGFPARIMIFKPPFRNGMSATRILYPQQTLKGDYASGYRFTHLTGLDFNTHLTDEPIDIKNPKGPKYRDGVVWIHASEHRTLLLDNSGHILLAVGAINTTSFGGKYSDLGACGVNPTTDFALNWPGGQMGQSDNHLYLADEANNRIARFALPYRVTSGSPPCMPAADGGLAGIGAGHTVDPTANDVGPGTLAQDRSGIAVWKNQLIARDTLRYVVWNDYLQKRSGSPGDVFPTQPDGNSLPVRDNKITGNSMHTIDDHDRLWCRNEHSQLMVWQLPMTRQSVPLRAEIPLYWNDTGEEIDYECDLPLTWDNARRHLWVYDTAHHRLLRVRNPDNFAGRLLVDVVIGQKNKTDGQINGGNSVPSASSFGDVNDIKFDHKGNLFVVDNTYEGHLNGRILGFATADLKTLNPKGMGVLFSEIKARYLFITETFDQTDIGRIGSPIYGEMPFSPVTIAFNSRDEMVVGNDGYYRFDGPNQRETNQLFLFRTPLKKPTPDAVIELPMGAPAEMVFDSSNNLVVKDATWNRIWVINYDTDPVWLRPLSNNPPIEVNPQVLVMVPNAVSGIEEGQVVFDTVYYDPQSANDLALCSLIVSPTSSSNTVIAFAYRADTNQLFGLDDDGNWVGGFAPGSHNEIQTSKGTLNCAATRVRFDKHRLTVTWSLHTVPGVNGVQNIYARASDLEGHISSTPQIGKWTITTPNASPKNAPRQSSPSSPAT